MISFEEAYRIVIGQATPLPSETAPLRHAAGRILAREVSSDVDLPPFDKSAMDGYACRRGDLPGPLRVAGTIQAGMPPRKALGPGECMKIMTGAVVPENADCVVMVEQAEVDADGLVRFSGSGTADNICRRGEDVRKGDVLFRPGERIGPAHIAVLAAAGCVAPFVARLPRVGIIATGDELVEPEVTPGPSQIRNTNSLQLCAHLEEAGACLSCFGIVRDDKDALDRVFRRAMEENDGVILSGGVSMGDFDYVPEIMERNGLRLLFDAIAMQPGKPTTFGVAPGRFCFGLPGNPVSAFVQCELLVKPFLYAMMGHEYRAPHATCLLSQSYRRKNAAREAWLPVAFDGENRVRPVSYHGSAHIRALCEADGLINMPRGMLEIEEGASVRVRLL